MAQETERIYVVPLRVVKVAPRTKRANRAVTEVREFIARHMKTDVEKVWLDNPVNEALWARGILEPAAAERLTRVKMARPEVAASLEDQLVVLAQQGRLRTKVNDEMMRQFLARVAPKTRDIKIERK